MIKVEEKEKGVIIEEGKLGVKRTRYDKLVEDVISEKVTRDEGLDPERSARVVVGKDADGDPELHVFGRSREAVDAVADGVRSPRVSIRRRYIGHNVSPEEEANLIGVALEELAESAPRHVLPKLGAKLEELRVRLGLPRFEPVSQLLEAGDRVAESVLADALDGFEAKFDKNKKGGE
ncbi:hypothetical protein M1O52_04860 [Dehalococcoidia bacterium]|nr:hypothetical protein [Dehalococcoidia bacterium]